MQGRTAVRVTWKIPIKCTGFRLLTLLQIRQAWKLKNEYTRSNYDAMHHQNTAKIYRWQRNLCTSTVPKATDFLWKSRQHLESWQWKTGKEKGKEAVVKQRACALVRRIKYAIKNETNEMFRYVRLQMSPETETIPQCCSVCRLKHTMNYKLCLGLLIADSYNIVPFKKRSAQLMSWSVEEIAEVRSEPIKEYEIVARW